MSTAPKSTDEVPAGAPDTGIQSAEEMTDSMLRDSPFRDVEDEQRQQQEDANYSNGCYNSAISYPLHVCVYAN